jgi:hypothetical protein
VHRNIHVYYLKIIETYPILVFFFTYFGFLSNSKFIHALQLALEVGLGQAFPPPF